MNTLLKSLLLNVGVCVTLIAGAQNSEDEKQLFHYKELYSKGLITDKEYEAKRLEILHLHKELKGVPLNPLTDEPVVDTSTKQYNKTVTVNFRIIPVTTFEIGGTEKDWSGSNTAFLSSNEIEKLGFAGLHLELGPSIKKEFCPNIGIGIEGNNEAIFVPIYADLNFNLLKRKLTPFMHFGAGYLAELAKDETTFSDLSNGGLVMGGFGLHASISDIFAMEMALDYRFTFAMNTTRQYLYNYNGGISGSENYHEARFSHQMGFRIAFIFY